MGDPLGEPPVRAGVSGSQPCCARFTAPCATAAPQVLANCIIRAARPRVSFNCLCLPRATPIQSITRDPPPIFLLSSSHKPRRTEPQHHTGCIETTGRHGARYVKSQSGFSPSAEGWITAFRTLPAGELIMEHPLTRPIPLPSHVRPSCAPAVGRGSLPPEVHPA